MKATGIVRRIDDLGRVVGTSAPFFTIENNRKFHIL